MKKSRVRGTPIIVCDCGRSGAEWPLLIRQQHSLETLDFGNDFRWKVSVVSRIPSVEWVEQARLIRGECPRCETLFALRLDAPPDFSFVDDLGNPFPPVPKERVLFGRNNELTFDSWRGLHEFIVNHPDKVHVVPMQGVKQRVRVLKVAPSFKVRLETITIRVGADGKGRSEWYDADGNLKQPENTWQPPLSDWREDGSE